MRKKRAILFILSLLLINYVLADYCAPKTYISPLTDKSTTEYPPGCNPSGQPDYSSPQYYQSAPPSEWDYSKVEWDKVPVEKQKGVPPEHIPEIPPEKVDVTLVSDQEKLSSDQLIFGSPTPNIDEVEDWSGLNPKERDEALKQLGRVPVNVLVKTDTGNKPTDGTIFSDGFGFDQIEELQIGTTRVKKGKNVEYRNGKITADFVEEFEYKGSTSFNWFFLFFVVHCLL